MNPLLLVMNPRRIEECIESISRAPCDTAWLTGYRERDLMPVIRELIDSTSYSHYLIVSDDGIVPPHSVQAVIDTLADGHPYCTGYCNLDANDMRVNLTKLPFDRRDVSVYEDYEFWHLSEVIAHPTELVPTFFGGFALTGMTRDLWQQHPFYALGVPSDWFMSCRLYEAGVPMVAHQQAFLWHVKERVNFNDTEQRKRLLIGEVGPSVTIRLRGEGAP